MNSDDFIPEGLRPPALGDSLAFTWVANLGRDATVGAIAAHLQSLQVVLDLGERWGLIHAERAAAIAFELDLRTRGPEALNEAFESWPENRLYPHRYERAFSDPEYWYRRGMPGGYTAGPDDLIRLLSSREVPRLLGQSVRARHVEYNNPVEVVLFGAGFVLVGTVKVLRMIRDWSSQRRIGDSIADSAEAAAQQNKTAADLGAWLVEEAQAGRQHVPISDLLKYVGPQDLTAIQQLADLDVQLQLPPQLSGP
jgi:hypothetical protein